MFVFSFENGISVLPSSIDLPSYVNGRLQIGRWLADLVG